MVDPVKLDLPISRTCVESHQESERILSLSLISNICALVSFDLRKDRLIGFYIPGTGTKSDLGRSWHAWNYVDISAERPICDCVKKVRQYGRFTIGRLQEFVTTLAKCTSVDRLRAMWLVNASQTLGGALFWIDRNIILIWGAGAQYYIWFRLAIEFSICGFSSALLSVTCVLTFVQNTSAWCRDACTSGAVRSLLRWKYRSQFYVSRRLSQTASHLTKKKNQ